MSMKDLLNKMTELTGTQASTEVVSTTGKKVLTESKTEVKESKPSLKGIFNTMLSEAEQVTIQPAKQNTQVIKQGQKTLGTVENPQLAQQIKQSIGKGEMTLAGDELGEGEGSDSAPNVKKLIQRLENMQELIYQLPGGRRSNLLQKKRDELEARIETLPGGKELLNKWAKEYNDSFDMNETDMGQADARKSTPSSKEEQENVFAKHKERMNKFKDKDKKEGVAESKLNEKAVSKSQQQAAGAALAAKRGDELNEKWGEETKVAPSEKGKYEGKTKAELLKQYNALKAKGPHKKGSPDYGKMRELSFAIRAKSGWGKVDESVINEKAVSKSQQQAAGAALAAKRGDAPKSKLKGASKEMAKMPTKELEKFAGTKHKGLPDKKEKTDEAAMPTHDGDFGAGLGAGRNNKTLESKKSKPDFLDLDKDGNKKESMKKAAADKQKVSTMKKTNEAKAKPDFLDLDKDGNKTETMKKAAADKKKKTVKEGANPTEAARLLGKAHALGKDPFACKYEQGSPEAQAYLDGYKEGLDECYGSGGGMGMQQSIGMMPGMDSMVSMTDTQSPRGGSDFEVDSFSDFNSQPDEADMMAFEAWDRELNELLNEGKMKDIDIDMKELSDAQFKKAHGKTKAQMTKDLSGSTDKNKKTVSEGISVSVSKGNQGAPDSVTVSAQDSEADALLAMIKQAGLGLFGGDDQTSSYGAPVSQDQVTAPQGGDVGDHDSMMALIKKMTTGSNDYEDEESHDSSTCSSCGSSDCSCDDESDSKALVVGEEQGYDDKEDESLGMRTGKESDKKQSMKDRRDDSYGKFGKRTDEDESEDQMEFEVAESNAPDSDEAETTADENAEAKEDQALAGAMSGDEEEIDEGSCSMDEEEELTEWANDAGYEGSENIKDNTFEEDIDFMTRVISGGLNGPKKDQTTLPHTRVKVDESIQDLNEWRKLSGIK